MTLTQAASEKYPPPPPETPRDRRTRLVALFVMPFLMVTMMYATYMGTMHAPKPQDMPLAVAGSGAADLADTLAATTDTTFDVRVTDADEASALVADREVAGALVLEDDRTATLHVAYAAGPSQASTVTALVAPIAGAAGYDVTTQDLAPLPGDDGSGTMVLFAAMGMMLAGYVPLSGLIQGTPNLLRVRRFMPLALVWSAVMSSVIWLILGPGMGAVEGHFPAFLGIGTLTVLAVATTQFLFTKILGPLAVLLGMLLFVVFGMPASGLALPLESMPGFFRFLHHGLPLGQAGEALRSVVYFDAADARGPVLVLAAWVVVALTLCVLKERRSGTAIVGGPLHTAPDAPLPALAGGPVAPYRRRLFAVAAFPAAITVTVVTLMSLSMGSPTVSELPVAVVGPEQATTQFAAGVGEQLGDYVDLSETTSRADAEDLLQKQELVAAYVLPTSADGEATLLTAAGAGASQKSVAVQMFTPVAQGSGTTLAVEDIAPLTEDDVNGSDSLYVGMSWIMAGFLIFAVFRGGAPDLTRTRQLLPFIGGWAVGMSLWLWFLYDVLIGSVNGHALAMIAAGAFTIFCTAWASAVLVRMFGLGALVPTMIVIMLAGVPASGGGLSIYMVPEAFRWAADVLPLPAAVDIARSLVYFDGVGVGRDLLVLLAWGVAGLLLNVLVVDRWLARRNAKPHAPLGPRVMPEPRSSEEEALAAA